MARPDSRPSAKGALYRQLRLWHGYLSAAAFLILIFFAATGLLLNHPDWFAGELPPAVEQEVQLSPAEIEALRTANVPGERLVELLDGRVETAGAYLEGNLLGDDLFVRLQGVKGSTTLIADLRDGRVAVTLEPEHPLNVLNELHRGERAGEAWRWLIDISAVLLIALSIVGYSIFLSLRNRLSTALALTGLSLLAMVGLFVFLVS